MVPITEYKINVVIEQKVRIYRTPKTCQKSKTQSYYLNNMLCFVKLKNPSFFALRYLGDAM